MNLVRVGAALVLAGALALPGAALAQTSRLQVIIGGEAYDGPPRFEISFDGALIGEGIVEAAIDTAKAGRFADAPDKTPYVQTFEFEVPDTLFKPDGEVRVRLVNEAYGGDGTGRDRNLYLAAVTLNGGAVTVSGLVTAGRNGFKPNRMVGEFLVLTDGNEQGVSPAPRGGWPEPSAQPTALAQARLAAEPAGQPELLPVPGVTAIRAPTEVVEVAVAEPDPNATASLEAAAPAARCVVDQIYNVVGFNESSNELTPRLIERLDQIVEDIGDAECRLLVTGYSDTQGSHATNALFAIERAQNVLAYLRRAGLKYYKATAAGGGATKQFGEQPSANRRVVIAVTP